MKERANELERQRDMISEELLRARIEGSVRCQEWFKCNRRYLRKQKQMGSLLEPLVLDIDDTTQLQQASQLLALDTQRANLQLSITQLQRKLLDLLEAWDGVFAQYCKLLGVEREPHQIKWFEAKKKEAQEMIRDLGQTMLRAAIGQE